MELLDTCQIAQLRQFIARRITTESLASNR
jgi:hypothetical protein